jgi:hypothetical protein
VCSSDLTLSIKSLVGENVWRDGIDLLGVGNQ